MVLHAAKKKPADYVNEPWLATEEPFQQTINRLLYEIILMWLSYDTHTCTRHLFN